MLAAQFSPGPDMLLLLKAAVNYPLRVGLGTVAGIVAGLSVHCATSALGLSMLLQTNPLCFKLLLLLGAAYLGWLGVKLLLSLRQASSDSSSSLRTNSQLSVGGGFMQGFLTNITNVKAFLFLTSFISAGLTTDPSSTRRWILVAIILGQALVFWSLFLWLLKRPPLLAGYQRLERPLNGLFGILLLVLAAQTLRAVFQV